MQGPGPTGLGVERRANDLAPKYKNKWKTECSNSQQHGQKWINLAEYSEEGYDSKRDALPMMTMMSIMIIFL
jgi:hypothetical protein